MKILVTGAAGFIGHFLALRLASEGDEVVGIDCINDYYDVRLKYGRLAEAGFDAQRAAAGEMTVSALHGNYRFRRMRIDDRDAMERLFAAEHFDTAVNLAAQAGVRYSLENPYAYAESNLMGFVTVLECCRRNGVRHLVYASSSSVYGGNTKVPFSEDDPVERPVSLYAATKRADELMAYTYSNLYGFPTTGLRFFTVYGPWGRPDMAPMLFARAMCAGEPIKVFNGGDMSRDFTYVDDIVDGVMRVVRKGAESDNASEVYNIGCSHPVRLTDFISTMERALGVEARKTMMPMQKGDVYRTYADTSKLERDFGYRPSTMLEEGIARFVEWYSSDKNPLR